MQDTDLPEALLVPEGDAFRPTDHARGPWSPGSLHGRVLGGLAGHEIERQFGDDDFQISRLTTELFRAATMAPLRVETVAVREGNRIRVIDAAVTSDGVEVARSRAVMLKRAEQPEGNVWGPPRWDVPPPEGLEPEAGHPATFEVRPIRGGRLQVPVQKQAWLREQRPLIEGEPLTPFVRVALASDFSNPFANAGDQGLNFVNADITLYLYRLPVSEWIGFEVSTHWSVEGIALGECTLYDLEGPIGRSAVAGLANRHR